MFRDRREAGIRLAGRLADEAGGRPVVYALPRGGVPVAVEIATRLGAPLDLLIVRKLGAPSQPELAIGAVIDGAAPGLVLNDELVAAFGLDQAGIEAIAARERREIERRRARYLGGRAPVSPAGRTAIVVDDGVATGATARVALQALRRQGASRIVLAVPVAPRDTLEMLGAEADRIVVLESPELFRAVGEWYRIFDQVSDEAVVEALRQAPR